jgi:hypothetical protein
MFTIPNLRLNIINGFIFIIIIAIIFTFLTYLNNDLSHSLCKEINEAEYKLTTKEYITLYVNRFLHFMYMVTIISLPYVFAPNLYLYIIYVMLNLLLGILGKYLLIESPFSIHEKQLLNKNYINGDSIIQPHLLLLTYYDNHSIIDIIYNFNLLLVLFSLFTSAIKI